MTPMVRVAVDGPWRRGLQISRLAPRALGNSYGSRTINDRVAYRKCTHVMNSTPPTAFHQVLGSYCWPRLSSLCCSCWPGRLAANGYIGLKATGINASRAQLAQGNASDN